MSVITVEEIVETPVSDLVCGQQFFAVKAIVTVLSDAVLLDDHVLLTIEGPYGVQVLNLGAEVKVRRRDIVGLIDDQA